MPTPPDWFYFGQKILATLPHHYQYRRGLPIECCQNFTGSLMIGYWLELTGIRPKDLVSSGVYPILGIFGTMTRHYDNFIDSPDGRKPSFARSDFKDKRSDIIVSQLVGAIKKSLISKEEKRRLLRLAAQFRRTELEILNSRTPQTSKDFGSVVAVREATNTPLALVVSDILCSPFNLAKSIKERSNVFWVHFCHAGQAIDDLADCQVDFRQGVLNLFSAALNNHPQEKQGFAAWCQFDHPKFWLDELDLLAPQSLEMVKAYIENQVAEIPAGTRADSALKFAYYLPKGLIR